jgi:hypothetical protein
MVQSIFKSNRIDEAHKHIQLTKLEKYKLMKKGGNKPNHNMALNIHVPPYKARV